MKKIVFVFFSLLLLPIGLAAQMDSTFRFWGSGHFINSSLVIDKILQAKEIRSDSVFDWNGVFAALIGSSARVKVAAADSAGNIPPFRFTIGNKLTATPQPGALEFYGDSLYVVGEDGVRRVLAVSTPAGGGGGAAGGFYRTTLIKTDTPGVKVHLRTVAGDTTKDRLFNDYGTAWFGNTVDFASDLTWGDTVWAQRIGRVLKNCVWNGNKIDAGSYIQDLSITAGQIANATITATQIHSATITGALIAAATITGSNIAAATITGGLIASGTITGGNIATGTITGGLIGNSTITAGNIASATITAGLIANLTITAAQIQNLTINGTKITNATLDSTKIATASVSGQNIVAGAIIASKICSGTITATQIAAGTITGATIAAATIAAGNIIAGTITTSQIAANTIVAGNIAASTITSDKLSVSTLSAISANLGSVTAGDINIGSGAFHVTTGGALTATSATITGAITATSGTVGGFTVNSTDGLYSGTGATRVQMKPGAGFWAGATAQGSAPFSVSAAGALTATSATISGSISSSTITSSTLTTAASGARVLVGAGTGSGYINFYDGSGASGTLSGDGSGNLYISVVSHSITLSSGANITLSPDTYGTLYLSGHPISASGSSFTFNSNTVWHAGNDGTGSGLDADLLDGSHASAFSLTTHNHDGVYAKWRGYGTSNPGSPAEGDLFHRTDTPVRLMFYSNSAWHTILCD